MAKRAWVLCISGAGTSTPFMETHPKPHFRVSWVILTSRHVWEMHVLVQEGLWKPLFYDSAVCFAMLVITLVFWVKRSTVIEDFDKQEQENTPNSPVQFTEAFSFPFHVLLSWNWVTKALHVHTPSLPLNWISWQWQIFCLKTQDVPAVFTSVPHQFYQPQLLKTEL